MGLTRAERENPHLTLEDLRRGAEAEKILEPFPPRLAPPGRNRVRGRKAIELSPIHQKVREPGAEEPVAGRLGRRQGLERLPQR